MIYRRLRQIFRLVARRQFSVAMPKQMSVEMRRIVAGVAFVVLVLISIILSLRPSPANPESMATQRASEARSDRTFDPPSARIPAAPIPLRYSSPEKESLVAPLGTAENAIFKRIGEKRVDFPPAGGTPDFLEDATTMEVWWPDGEPQQAGWFRRVRVVRADFKVPVLRLEERVRVAGGGADPVVLETLLDSAMAAEYLLIDGSAVAALPQDLKAASWPRNPNVLRVAVPDPNDPRSLPEMVSRLAAALPVAAEIDRLFTHSGLPADPLVANGVAWHLDNLGIFPGQTAGADIGAAEAYEVRTEAADTLIALLDSGIDHSDPEIAGSIHIFPGETIGDQSDDDGNGYADDAFGYDFYDDDNDPDAGYGHGNACASLIGAAGGNGRQSSGVAGKARILDCRIFGASGYGLVSDAVDALDYARQSDARVVNMSWGYPGSAPVLERALRRCNDAGILLVCASGNEANRIPLPVPAAMGLPLLVAVAASDAGDRLASFSNVDHRRVHLAAPGVAVAVSQSRGLEYQSGTSFAAPLVSAALALAIEQFPGETPERLVRKLMESVDPIRGGSSALRSGGRLNFRKAAAFRRPRTAERSLRRAAATFRAGWAVVWQHDWGRLRAVRRRSHPTRSAEPLV